MDEDTLKIIKARVYVIEGKLNLNQTRLNNLGLLLDNSLNLALGGKFDQTVLTAFAAQKKEIEKQWKEIVKDSEEIKKDWEELK